MPTMPAPADWSYFPPGDPLFGDVDTVRFYAQDTDPELRLLSDHEVQYLVDVWYPKYSSLILVAAVAAQVIAAKFTGVVSISADGVSVNVADLAQRYRDLFTSLYQTFQQETAVGGDIDLSNLGWDAELDPSIAPLSFSVGMHDNINAGQQNYGGTSRGHEIPDLIYGI